MEQPPLDAPDKPSEQTSDNRMLWLKRLGIGGFLFFLGKGLLWLFLGKAALAALCNWFSSQKFIYGIYPQITQIFTDLGIFSSKNAIKSVKIRVIRG